VLKETTDSLIEHIEKIKNPRQWKIKLVTGKEIRDVGVIIDGKRSLNAHQCSYMLTNSATQGM